MKTHLLEDSLRQLKLFGMLDTPRAPPNGGQDHHKERPSVAPVIDLDGSPPQRIHRMFS